MKHEKKPTSNGRQTLPPPLPERRIIGEAWAVLAVAAMIVTVAGILLYSLFLDPGDPRKTAAALWAFVIGGMLAAYANWRWKSLVNRKE